MDFDWSVELPDLAWLCVIEHLRPNDILSLSLVCSQINMYCSLDEIWLSKLREEFSSIDCDYGDEAAKLHYEHLYSGLEITSRRPWTHFLMLDFADNQGMVFSTRTNFNRMTSCIHVGQGEASWGDFQCTALRFGSSIAFKTIYGDGLHTIYLGGLLSTRLALGCFRSTWNLATGTFMSEARVPGALPNTIDGYEWHEEFTGYHAKRIGGREALFALSGRCWQVRCAKAALCGIFVVANQASNGMECYFQLEQGGAAEEIPDMPVGIEGIAVQDERSMLAVSLRDMLWLAEVSANRIEGYILHHEARYRFVATVQQ